jgi:replicative DNA helicase
MSNKDSEEFLDLSVLRGILSDKNHALTFNHKYSFDLFGPKYQVFAKLVTSYISSFRCQPTKRTLIDRYKEHQDYINQTWAEIYNYKSDPKEYNYDLAQLKTRFQKEGAIKIKELSAQVDDKTIDPEKYFKKLALEIQRVCALDVERGHIQKPVGDYVPEFRERYETIEHNPEATSSIKTGISMIDAITNGGPAPSELVMIGGESGAGKSFLLNSVGKNIWQQTNTIESTKFLPGKNVLYLSLEMDYDQCFNRFLASLANLPKKSLINGKLAPDQKIKMNQALDFIERYQASGCYFDIVDAPRNITIEDVELRYNDALLKYRPDVVVVDYMGLMESKLFSKEQDWLKLGAISANLHEFARVYDCLVITAAQLTDLNRSSNMGKDAERSKRVGMHRWGRSSLIMHNVNLAVQIETRSNEKQYPDMKIHAVKNRKGPLAEGVLIKNLANATLVDVPFDEKQIQGDISASIPDLIKQIQSQRAAQETA